MDVNGTHAAALAVVAGLMLVGAGCAAAPESDGDAKGSRTTDGPTDSGDSNPGKARMPSVTYTVYIDYDEFTVDVAFAEDGSWAASGDHEDSGRLDEAEVEEVAAIAADGIEEGEHEEGIECADVVAKDAWKYRVGEDSVSSDKCAYDYSEEEARLTEIIQGATGLDLAAARKLAG